MSHSCFPSGRRPVARPNPETSACTNRRTRGIAGRPVPCRVSPAKTDETAQPSSSSSSSSSSSNREIEDDDEDEDENDQDGSFLFPIRPQAGGPTTSSPARRRSAATEPR
jgi:hypothetical protein